ncbi:hypothetical protein PMAYCL1PPCAC_02887 [Pristionchus mayeri]|uniref:Uncharacterized protein n=1 Tax=Pristionchus mayeri TaxID=1317129 RepID=A0AAN4Z266_9BILA|nr:hypothetical protein PMAYCL1PPCAC_02887 [Pristionchus mayeri]
MVKRGLDGVVDPLLEGSVLLDKLGINSIGNEATFGSHSLVVSLVILGESPLLGDDDKLTSGELELGTTEGLNGVLDVLLPQANGEEEISDVDTCDKSVGLSVSSTHTGLKTISTGTRKHLVDTDDVVRVLSDTHVEGILSAVLDE